MSCYHPRPAFEYVENSTGEVFYSLWHPHVPSSQFPVWFKMIRTFKVPCRQCIGCRDKYSFDWAIRCEHESKFYSDNCFLTLTVDDAHMEEVFPGSSLRYEPFQDFMHDFRKKVGNGIRFFMCGEYGEQLSRPHFHSIIFGWFPDVKDRVFLKKTPVGDLWISKLLLKLWPFGFHSVGNFSFGTAQYVAGYMLKKINGKLKAKYYGSLTPEFCVSSNGGGRRKAGVESLGGIGKQYYRKFGKEIFNAKDSVTLLGGTEVPVPGYYNKLHLHYHPHHMERVKEVRNAPNPMRDFLNSPEQLRIREINHRARRKSSGQRNNFNGGVR